MIYITYMPGKPACQAASKPASQPPAATTPPLSFSLMWAPIQHCTIFV